MPRRWMLAALMVLVAASVGSYAFASPSSVPKRHGWASYAPLAPLASVVAARKASIPRQCPHRPIDPRTALPLPADALGPATEAALRYFRAGHGGVAGVRGVIAEAATRQPPPARATARSLCGVQIAKRTVLVNVKLPEPTNEHSASLSFGLALVSRFASGYAVWFRLH